MQTTKKSIANPASAKRRKAPLSNKPVYVPPEDVTNIIPIRAPANLFAIVKMIDEKMRRKESTAFMLENGAILRLDSKPTLGSTDPSNLAVQGALEKTSDANPFLVAAARDRKRLVSAPVGNITKSWNSVAKSLDRIERKLNKLEGK